MKDMQKQVLDEILHIMGVSDKRVHTNDKLMKRLTREVCDREKVRFDWLVAVADNLNLN